MTIEAMKQAMPLYTAYKQAETLLIMLNSPISKVDCNCASVSTHRNWRNLSAPLLLPPLSRNCDRLKAELEAL